MRMVPEWKVLEEAEMYKRYGKEVKLLDSCNRTAYPEHLWDYKMYSSTPVHDSKYGGVVPYRLSILIVKRH